MTPTRDDSIPADTADEGCRIALDASSSPLREWTEVRVASIEAVADERSPRFRVRLESSVGVITLTVTLGARMAPPVAVGERGRARACSFPTSTAGAATVAIVVSGETRLFEGPLDDARRLPDFTFVRGAETPDPNVGGTRVTVHLAREGRQAILGRSGGYRVLETPAGRWLCAGGHSEGRYGHSVFTLCKLVDNGAPRVAKRLPDDDRSEAVERIDGHIAARLAAPVPQGADGGVERRVSAIEVPDATAASTWQVMLAATGWRARLGLGVGEALPLVVTLPRGYALPLAVGDVVTLRALQAVVGIHPRHGVEVRVAGRAVLVEGDDDFLRGVAGVTVTKGPCTDPGKSRDGLAPLQRGMVRVELDGVAGYAEDARRPRALETASGKVLFAGSWTGFGAGSLPPDASARTYLALARV